MSEDDGIVYNPSRYKRLLWDFEVEVVDETALRAAILDYDVDTETGEYHEGRGSDTDVNLALWKLFKDAFDEKHGEYGLSFHMGGQTMPRPLTERGTFAPLNLPEKSARQNDGSFIEREE